MLVIRLHTRGSSPRVRGTGPFLMGALAAGRFIPACAGNSVRHTCQFHPEPVHPRVCGEQHYYLLHVKSHCGSSPRVRGTDSLKNRRSLNNRFIPACAGNSWFDKYHSDVYPVHPRVCGEQLWTSIWISLSDGSSPRVRGTEYRFRFRHGEQRFIPACAGNRCLR